MKNNDIWEIIIESTQDCYTYVSEKEWKEAIEIYQKTMMEIFVNEEKHYAVLFD